MRRRAGRRARRPQACDAEGASRSPKPPPYRKTIEDGVHGEEAGPRPVGGSPIGGRLPADPNFHGRPALCGHRARTRASSRRRAARRAHETCAARRSPADDHETEKMHVWPACGACGERLALCSAKIFHCGAFVAVTRSFLEAQRAGKCCHNQRLFAGARAGPASPAFEGPVCPEGSIRMTGRIGAERALIGLEWGDVADRSRTSPEQCHI